MEWYEQRTHRFLGFAFSRIKKVPYDIALTNGTVTNIPQFDRCVICFKDQL